MSFSKSSKDRHSCGYQLIDILKWFIDRDIRVGQAMEILSNEEDTFTIENCVLVERFKKYKEEHNNGN